MTAPIKNNIKRKLGAPPEGQPLSKKCKYETPSTEDALSKLIPELKEVIFTFVYKDIDLTSFLKLREINHDANDRVISVCLRFFQEPQTVQLSSQDLERFEIERTQLYANSNSKDFLNCMLQKPFLMLTREEYAKLKEGLEFSAETIDENSGITEEMLKEEVEAKWIEYNLKKITHTYPSSCKKFVIYSLRFLEEYAQKASNSSTFKPIVLQCFFEDDPLLSNSSSHEEKYSSIERKAYYDKLESFLTPDLQKFKLSISPWIFNQITGPVTSQDSRISNLLFGKQLVGLSHLNLDFSFKGIPPADMFLIPPHWSKDRCLTQNDVYQLEALTPHLRHLSLIDFSLAGNFFAVLLESPLLEQLETLNLKDCYTDDPSYLANFLKLAHMPNLKLLGLPQFYYMEDRDQNEWMDHDELSSDWVIPELSSNISLTNLEVIILTHSLNQNAAISLLTALAANKSLTNLKAIKEFVLSERERKIPLAYRNLLSNSPTFGENFDWTCINDLFEENS